MKFPSGVTLRSLAIGSLLSLLVGVGAPYSNMVIRGSRMAMDFSTAAALFLFFLFVGILNLLLGLIKRRFALRTGELATVYIMMIVACSIPTKGFSGFLPSVMTGAFYYATPENDWAELVHPHMPRWLAPEDQEAVWQFYEGLPKGASIPWEAWIRPLAYWGLFFIALSFVMVCIMVILRRQWMDNEKLVYPMVQVPMEMIREGEGDSPIKPFFGRGIMWIGFMIPVLIGSVNAFHHYYHFIPPIELQMPVPLFRRTLTMMFKLNFTVIGFSYFINLEIALGIWFFYLLSTLQQGIYNTLGFYSAEKLGTWSGSPLLAHEGAGALIVFVLFMLWTARGHLRDVLRRAFRGDADVDDSEEILSYRAAVYGMIGGLLVMVLWLWRSGIPLWIVPIFLFMVFVIYIALTRVVMEGGVAAAQSPIIASDFVISGLGTSALGPSGLVSMGLTYAWHSEVRTFVMASCANGLKLGREMIRNRKGLFWAIMLAVVISVVGSLWVMLYSAYTYGGINLRQLNFVNVPQYSARDAAPRILTPVPVSWSGWITTAAGGAVMWLLMLARQRFLWWPVHPLGFLISFQWMARTIWFGVFLAWLIKSSVLKYGGPRMYRSTRPFFLGLILGEAVIAGLWLIVDHFTGMHENVVATFW